jgi:hypothetical protein
MLSLRLIGATLLVIIGIIAIYAIGYTTAFLLLLLKYILADIFYCIIDYFIGRNY